MLCFAYGSNMSLARLRQRVPSARFVAVASLLGYRLAFHKLSKDGSGKCDVARTGNPLDRVVGVVFEITDIEKPALDRNEGLGDGYEEKELDVLIADGAVLRVKTYVATRIDATLKPYCWYKQHVLLGARENRLPAAYLARIEAVAAITDPNRKRRERELAIYR